MIKAIATLSLLGLVGCATLPTDTPPKWQNNSDHYLLSGRQGWMPGQQLAFGDNQIDVDKSSELRFVDDVLFNARHQSVTLNLKDSSGVKAKLRYEQKCDGHRGSLTIIEPNKFTARVSYQGKQASFTDPYNFTFGGHHYQMRYGESNWPQVIKVSRDAAPFVELHLGVSDGSWNTQDHVWVVNSLSAEDAKVAALLSGYAVTYDPEYCDYDEDDDE